MSKYILSPRARDDIEEIWNYTVANWGIEQVEFYIGTIRTALESLCKNPQKGRSCNNIRAVYYKLAVASHIVFYREIALGIDVIRILHQRMDYVRYL